MATDDRDQEFERALSRHLRHASPDPDCPDAEILAAYHERALSPEEMAYWKQHIVGCAQCQESLALLEQTENIPAGAWEKEQLPATAENIAVPQPAAATYAPMADSVSIAKARPRPSWRWLVPMGALAAAVIVSIGVWEIRTQRRMEIKDAQMAQNQPTSPALLQSQAGTSNRLRKEEETAPGSGGLIPAPKTTAPPSADVLSQERKAAAARVSTPSSVTNEKAIPEQGGGLTASQQETAATREPLPSVSGYVAKSHALDAPVPPPANAAVIAGAAPGPGTESKKDQSAKVPPASATQTVEVQAAAPPVAANSSQILAQKEQAATLVQLALASSRYIVSPGEKHAWRAGDLGSIEHSTDRGKNWKSQNSGVTADLTSGSATSDKICWIVGKAGTILLTTDGGKHWKQLASPIPGDLGGIHARDATRAVLWDVPHRISYETTDGGATWTRIANH